jgi:hypothetical protein
MPSPPPSNVYVPESVRLIRGENSFFIEPGVCGVTGEFLAVVEGVVKGGAEGVGGDREALPPTGTRLIEVDCPVIPKPCGCCPSYSTVEMSNCGFWPTDSGCGRSKEPCEFILVYRCRWWGREGRSFAGEIFGPELSTD